MSLTTLLRFAALSIMLLVCSGIVAAQSATSPNLAMNATVATTLRLDISTHASGATVGGSGGAFTLALGTLNGLGTGSPATNVNATVVNSSGAVYTTPINVTPVYTGFDPAEKATVTVARLASTNGAMAREGSSNANTVDPSVATPVTITDTADSDAAIVRYVGLYVARSEVAGAKSATLVYTVTVP